MATLLTSRQSIPNGVYRIKSSSSNPGEGYLARTGDELPRIVVQQLNPSSDSQLWSISRAHENDTSYRVAGRSGNMNVLLSINNARNLICTRSNRGTVWTIEPRGKDAYVIGNAVDTMAISLSGTQRNQRASVSSRDNTLRQRWILESLPVTVAESETRYTQGTQGRIIVRNNLRVPITAALGSSIRGYGQTSQFPVSPGSWEQWTRSGSERVHINIGGTFGSFRTYIGWLGSSINIDDDIQNTGWHGVTLDTSARYTPGAAGFITLQNNLDFSVYVTVLSGTWGSGQTQQFMITQKQSDSWNRSNPEVVLVSMGSTPGIVRAFMGRPGFILHIDNLM